MKEPPTKLLLELQNSGLGDTDIIERLRERGHTEQEINDAFNQAKVKDTIKTDEFSPETPELPEAPGDFEVPGPVAAQAAGPATMKQPQPGMQAEPQPAMQEEAPMPATQEMPQPAPSSPQTQPALPPQPQEYVPAPSYGYETGGSGGYEDYGTETGGYAQPEGAYTVEDFEEIVESIVEERWRAFIERIGDIQGWKEGIDRELARIDKRMERIDDSLNSINAALLEKVGEYGKNIKTLGSDVKAVEKALSQILDPLMRNVRELKGVTEKLKSRKRKK